MSKVLLHNGDIETYRKNDHSEGNSYTLKKGKLWAVTLVITLGTSKMRSKLHTKSQ